LKSVQHVAGPFLLPTDITLIRLFGKVPVQ
jgi:hypothetical protein